MESNCGHLILNNRIIHLSIYLVKLRDNESKRDYVKSEFLYTTNGGGIISEVFRLKVTIVRQVDVEREINLLD